MYTRKFFALFFCLFLGSIIQNVVAQPTWTLDPFGKEKKPEQYEEKILGSEKTATKKFTTFRHFVQNNVTHYNFYYNANNKLKAVVERAKLSHQDDYSKLLSFYPYSLENTVSQSTELDSVIYKSTAGILLHDLRTDWVDNLYLLIGQAYFYRKDFDSAAMAFQFINYNLFPRKKNEDDSRIIGANQEASGSEMSIADKEKRSTVDKMLTLPPSRNDALIWLTRSFIEVEQFGDAAGMINILQHDPNLPKRLKDDLEEVMAYWFYRQNIYDSTAIHLERALGNAETKQDKARWEYLLAQLYEISGGFGKASEYYDKAARHTANPVMDIYSRLNDAKMARGIGDTKELEKNIERLKKMAKKDKYEAYRDIIYYSTGRLSIQLTDTTSGITNYLKSIKYNEDNLRYRNLAYLQLANIAYEWKEFAKAAAYYDSLMLPDEALAEEMPYIENRKNILSKVVLQLEILRREDSLQALARLSPADRDALIKKMAKKYMKEHGIKEEEDNFTGNTLISFSNKNQPSDLFDASSSRGDWYFYNTNMRSKGYTEFKSRWGKRPNIDNWRRKTSKEASLTRDVNQNIDIDAPDTTTGGSKIDSANAALVPYSYDALMADIPLTQEKLDSSNTRIAASVLELARIFQNELQDYNQAINMYLLYLEKFSDTTAGGEIYLGLYYCYNKLGNKEKAEYYKNLLTSRFSDTNYAKAVTEPATLDTKKANPEATLRYENIYNLFIEGKFVEALAQKKSADSLFGNNYWTPQLLYLEAVYYVKEREDSSAIKVLDEIITLYPDSPLKEKAETMKTVLAKRKEIENYLTNLQVTRVEEEAPVIFGDNKAAVANKEAPAPGQVAPIQRGNRPVMTMDSVKSIALSGGGFTLQPEKPHHVIMVFDKVDPVYVNEAKIAFTRFNNSNHSGQSIVIAKDVLDKERPMLIFSSFADADEAIKYYDGLKKAAPTSLSWLNPTKYSFLIITEANLKVLKTNLDVQTYKTLLNSQYSNKF